MKYIILKWENKAQRDSSKNYSLILGAKSDTTRTWLCRVLSITVFAYSRTVSGTSVAVLSVLYFCKSD